MATKRRAKSGAKKAAGKKKSAPKKAARASAKKPSAVKKKSTGKKATAPKKKSAAKKSPTKKSPTKKSPTKKKSAPKKSAPKKSASEKSVAKKKSAPRSTAPIESQPAPAAEQELDSPGWKAIDEACIRIYGDAEPLHYAPEIPFVVGGNDPLEGISVYASDQGTPHWHFVTYGFSELHLKESEDPDHSGFGFELTFRLAREPGEDPPAWVFNVLQNLARYVFRTGNPFGVGHHVPLNGPIALGHHTEIHSVAFALDPELGEIETPFGSVTFLQMVGITRDEAKAIKRWSSTGMLELLAARDEWLITSLDRPSLLSEDATRRQIFDRTAAEGSSSSASFTSQLEFAQNDEGVNLEVGAIAVEDLVALVDGRIRFGRDFSLMGKNALVTFEPAETAGWSVDASELKICVTPDLARELAESVKAHRGTYSFRTLPTLRLEIVPTEIKDQQGQVTETIG